MRAARFLPAASVAASIAVVVLSVAPAGAASPTTRRSTTPAATGAAGPVVSVTFDTPGATPRPLKETVQKVAGVSHTLTMDVRAISYPGIVCGFTFRGTRPAAPVTIRVSGAARNGRFDSGALPVSWTAGTEPKVTAGASADARAGWSFSAEAHANRNGPGWVVSVGGVPLQKDTVGKPTSASCVVTAGPGASFSPANGPVGYWAGFATA